MPGLDALLLSAAAFVAMEPVTAATHRWVMHGIGERLHRSHHRSWQRTRRRTESATRAAGTARLEANDWYPVMFAAIVNLGFFAGFNWDGFGALVPAGVGVTVYGMAYALVHDVYIHGRLGWFTNRRVAAFDRLAEAHRIHHLYNAAPFGMLAPVVPAALRQRAAGTDRNPLARV